MYSVFVCSAIPSAQSAYRCRPASVGLLRPHRASSRCPPVLLRRHPGPGLHGEMVKLTIGEKDVKMT